MAHRRVQIEVYHIEAESFNHRLGSHVSKVPRTDIRLVRKSKMALDDRPPPLEKARISQLLVWYSSGQRVRLIRSLRSATSISGMWILKGWISSLSIVRPIFVTFKTQALGDGRGTAEMPSSAQNVEQVSSLDCELKGPSRVRPSLS